MRVRSELVAGGLALLFGVIALLVCTGHRDGDVAVARWVAEHRTATGAAVFRVLANLGSLVIVVPATAICGGYLISRRRVRDALWLVGADCGAGALYALTKLVVARPRPELELRALVEKGYSFPSGHATQAAALWLTAAILLAVDRRARTRRVLFAAAAVLVLVPAASRIYLGVHWTLDVLGGLCLGGCVCFAVIALRAAHVRTAPPRPLRSGPERSARRDA